MTVEEALDALGLTREAATPDAINGRFRELALQMHPDRGGSADEMARLSAARSVLLGRAEPNDGEEGVVLNAFVGDREPTLRLAGALMGAPVMELDEGVWMVPFTRHLRDLFHRSEHQPETPPDWPFHHIDRVDAQRCALLAGDGRIAYLEVYGYKDFGHELGIGWRNGTVQLGPTDADWYSPGGGSIDQVARFLGVTSRLRHTLLTKGETYYWMQERE